MSAPDSPLDAVREQNEIDTDRRAERWLVLLAALAVGVVVALVVLGAAVPLG